MVAPPLKSIKRFEQAISYAYTTHLRRPPFTTFTVLAIWSLVINSINLCNIDKEIYP